jgi:hypothetical protein
MSDWSPKDPSDAAWYSRDVRGVVLDDVVATVVWTASPDSGLVLSTPTVSDGGMVIAVWLTGGTPGTHTLTATMTTVGGQTFQRSYKLKVRQL